MSQNLNLTVSEPITATVRSLADAFAAGCNLACTVEGQATLKLWREDTVAFRGACEKFAGWAQSLLAGKL